MPTLLYHVNVADLQLLYRHDLYCYMSQDSPPPVVEFHVLAVVGK